MGVEEEDDMNECNTGSCSTDRLMMTHSSLVLVLPAPHLFFSLSSVYTPGAKAA